MEGQSKGVILVRPLAGRPARAAGQSPRRLRALACAAATALVLSACSTMPPVDPDSASQSSPPVVGRGGSVAAGWRQARIVTPPAPLQCVPYARRLSGIAIRGDAWTWWRAAKGRYARSSKPQPGAVLVLSRTSHLRGGHLAVVTAVLSKREIVVSHANWLNRGRIHTGSLVIDVSQDNDWSAVRIWYTPGRRYGARTYPVYGFILPEPQVSAVAPLSPPS